MLEYARLEGQVVIVKEEAITTPINKTIDAIIIQEYLIQQIVYYHGNKSENAIIFSQKYLKNKKSPPRRCGEDFTKGEDISNSFLFCLILV